MREHEGEEERPLRGRGEVGAGSSELHIDRQKTTNNAFPARNLGIVRNVTQLRERRDTLTAFSFHEAYSEDAGVWPSSTHANTRQEELPKPLVARTIPTKQERRLERSELNENAGE